MSHKTVTDRGHLPRAARAISPTAGEQAAEKGCHPARATAGWLSGGRVVGVIGAMERDEDKGAIVIEGDGVEGPLRRLGQAALQVGVRNDGATDPPSPPASLTVSPAEIAGTASWPFIVTNLAATPRWLDPDLYRGREHDESRYWSLQRHGHRTHAPVRADRTALPMMARHSASWLKRWNATRRRRR